MTGDEVTHGIQHAQEIAEVVKSGDPVTTFITIFTIFLIALVPAVKLLKRFTSQKDAEIIRHEAETVLYSHLVDQITETKDDLEKAKSENKELWDLIKKLESRISRLENLRTEYEALKRILAERDREILELKRDNREKQETILSLEKRVKELELSVNTLRGE